MFAPRVVVPVEVREIKLPAVVIDPFKVIGAAPDELN
jgi:hypothetical protein